MNKQEYLISKGRIADPANGTLWIVKSTRNSVTMYEVPVWEITHGSTITYYGTKGGEEQVVPTKKYKINEFPYEINISNDTNIGEDHGYGTGIGDLWEWSYFVSPDKSVAEEILERERVRVQTQYLIF